MRGRPEVGCQPHLSRAQQLPCCLQPDKTRTACNQRRHVLSSFSLLQPGTSLHNHFSRSELTCLTTGEALERPCAVLGSPWQLIEQPQGFGLTDKPPNSSMGSPSIGDSLLGEPAMAVVAIALALGAGAFAAMQLAAVLASEGRLLAGSAAPGFGSAAASAPERAKTRCSARFDKRCVVNFFHYSSPPFTGSSARWF